MEKGEGEKKTGKKEYEGGENEKSVREWNGEGEKTKRGV